MTKVNDSPKNRGTMIGGAVTALLVAGGFTALAISGQSGERSSQKEGTPSVMLAQVGPGTDPTNPAPIGAGPAPQAGPSPSDKEALKGTSFTRMPDTYAAAAASGGGGGGGGGFGPPGGFGGGGGATAAAGAPTDWNKLKRHIARGKSAPSARPDPFVSYRFTGIEKLPAHFYIAPIRMAARPVPPTPPPSSDPDLQYGPLPFVPRRVAGILYNGSVSAILEIGAPGSGAEVFIVRPGDKVPSGIPGLDGDLTVTSISPTQLILRAEDGRTVTVALSGAPELQGQTTTTGGGFNPGASGGFRPGGSAAGSGGGAGKAAID